MSYPTEFGDYDEMYGSVDYEGAAVLDVGADHGSTAQYFLERGAKFVYASERDSTLRERLVEYAATEPRVAVLPEATAGLLPFWMDQVRPEVVKFDCEGCERIILELTFDLVNQPRAWLVETHTTELFRKLVDLFEFVGYEVTIVRDFGPMRTNPDKDVKVIKAERHE